MKRTVLQVTIRPNEYGEPGYFAVCPEIQGCHASGATPAEALDILQGVAKDMLEIRHRENLPLPKGHDTTEVLEGYLAVDSP